MGHSVQPDMENKTGHIRTLNAPASTRRTDLALGPLKGRHRPDWRQECWPGSRSGALLSVRERATALVPLLSVRERATALVPWELEAVAPLPLGGGLDPSKWPWDMGHALAPTTAGIHGPSCTREGAGT